MLSESYSSKRSPSIGGKENKRQAVGALLCAAVISAKDFNKLSCFHQPLGRYAQFAPLRSSSIIKSQEWGVECLTKTREPISPRL
jgi:hypothetical protein